MNVVKGISSIFRIFVKIIFYLHTTRDSNRSRNRKRNRNRKVITDCFGFSLKYIYISYLYSK